jgi:NADPH-dependent ferric siderophore reductase
VASVVRLVGDTAARLLFKPAAVGAVTDLDDFRSIELVGEKLAGADWYPGDKLRIHLDGLTLRTYTPLAWDQEAGSTTILAYLPGDGPGSEWCAKAKAGDSCSLFGPQRSVRLDGFDAPPIIVGDETTFGLTVAWRNLHPEQAPAATLFEVTRPTAAAMVLTGFDVAPTALVERTAADGHLDGLIDLVVDAVRASPKAPLCLTGRAQTIAPIRKRLKAEGLSAKDTAVKAYWDMNRKGLD